MSNIFERVNESAPSKDTASNVSSKDTTSKVESISKDDFIKVRKYFEFYLARKYYKNPVYKDTEITCAFWTNESQGRPNFQILYKTKEDEAIIEQKMTSFFNEHPDYKGYSVIYSWNKEKKAISFYLNKKQTVGIAKAQISLVDTILEADYARYKFEQTLPTKANKEFKDFEL